jgi:hypothetical protein
MEQVEHGSVVGTVNVTSPANLKVLSEAVDAKSARLADYRQSRGSPLAATVTLR